MLKSIALTLFNVKQHDSWKERSSSSYVQKQVHIGQRGRPLQRTTVATRAIKKSKKWTNEKNLLSQLTIFSFMVFIDKPQAKRWLVPQKRNFDPLPPTARSMLLITQASVRTASDSALSAATRSVHHICPDSYDGCGTENPISGYRPGKIRKAGEVNKYRASLRDLRNLHILYIKLAKVLSRVVGRETIRRMITLSKSE